MRRSISRHSTTETALALAVALALSCGRAKPVTPPSPAPAAAPAPGAAAGAAGLSADAARAADSVQRIRERYAAEVRTEIAGHENDRADKVFKNLKVFTGEQMTAARLLAAMNLGFGRSLGVSCDHCHVVGEWERDDKPQKQITREMMGMVATINGTLLKNIQNLRSPNPTVTCTTCHRGQVKPATVLP